MTLSHAAPFLMRIIPLSSIASVDPTVGSAAGDPAAQVILPPNFAVEVDHHRDVVGIASAGHFPSRRAPTHGGWAATDLNVLSSVFLRMIKSLIVPLLFATLVVGIAGHGDDMKRVGRLGVPVDHLLRDRDDAGAGGRIARRQHRQAGRGVDLGAASTKEGAEFAATQTTLTGVHRAHGPAELLRRGREERSAADRRSSRSSSPSRCRRCRGRARRSCSAPARACPR